MLELTQTNLPAGKKELPDKELIQKLEEAAEQLRQLAELEHERLTKVLGDQHKH
jgi:hypothetical protein